MNMRRNIFFNSNLSLGYVLEPPVSGIYEPMFISDGSAYLKDIDSAFIWGYNSVAVDFKTYVTGSSSETGWFESNMSLTNWWKAEQYGSDLTTQIKIDGTVSSLTATNFFDSFPDFYNIRIEITETDILIYKDSSLVKDGSLVNLLSDKVDVTTNLYLNSTYNGVGVPPAGDSMFDFKYYVDGSIIAYYPMREDSGNTVYNVIDNNLHMTGYNGFDSLTWTRDNSVSCYLSLYGYRKSGDVYIPSLLDGSSAADGNALTNIPPDVEFTCPLQGYEPVIFGNGGASLLLFPGEAEILLKDMVEISFNMYIDSSITTQGNIFYIYTDSGDYINANIPANTNDLKYNIKSGGVTSSDTHTYFFDIGKFTTVGLKWSGTTLEIYKDSSLINIDTVEDAGNILGTTASISLMNSPTDNPLKEEQSLSHFRYTTDSSLVVYYPICEESGNISYNVISNNYHLSGASPCTWQRIGEAPYLGAYGYNKSGSVYIPSNINGLLAADGSALTNTPPDVEFYTAIVDIDGNIYTSVTIGTQEWLVENLKTTRYKNGISITNLTNSIDWIADSSGAYAWYDNSIGWYKELYGGLYNWYAVDHANGLAPNGWRIPTKTDFETLRDYLGGEPSAGGPLKETGIVHWNTPNTGATNETGFTLLPGGSRYYEGAAQYENMGINTRLWTSTNYNATVSYFFIVHYNYAGIYNNYEHLRSGYSVRCLRNSGVGEMIIGSTFIIS